jgi:hypothetical protein
MRHCQRNLKKFFQMTFKIHATRGDETVVTELASPTMAVARSRMLTKQGWQVHIIDSNDRRFSADEFHHILSFD